MWFDAQRTNKRALSCRKTGVSIPSRTQVDEHGFQPLESIFSSPQKPSAAAEENDESVSEDMEIASSRFNQRHPLREPQCNADRSILRLQVPAPVPEPCSRSDTFNIQFPRA